MKTNRNFTRKIIYFTAIAVLLVPMSYISRPSTSRKEGGVLARMRSEYHLSQSSLGEIDPAGASMSLATLGLRGVAVNQLWMYAIRCKMKENYDGLKAATTQITKLQPNFLSVWLYQAHNLSYNISVEFDDYRHRYHWVKKGIDYLVDGTHYNRDQPRLLAELGWFCGHKFGRSDEHVQFRRLFRTDTDFHQFFQDQANIDMAEALGPDQRPDTWLLSHLWYRRGEQAVDTKNIPITGHSPLLFHSFPPKSLIDFANAIEEEGYLDEKGQEAWRVGERAWLAYGDRPIPTTRNFDIRLNDLDLALSMQEKAWAELEKLAPGLRTQLEAKKREALPEDQRVALSIPQNDRNQPQQVLAATALDAIQVNQQEFAAAAPSEVRRAVREWVERAEREKDVASFIKQYRDQVNFDYWLMRCRAEQEEVMVSARKHALKADELFDQTALLPARQEYETAWAEWAKVYEKYPNLVFDSNADDVLAGIVRYQSLLSQLEEDFPPKDFPLIDLINNRRADYNEMVEDQLGGQSADTPSEDDPSRDPTQLPAEPN